MGFGKALFAFEFLGFRGLVLLRMSGVLMCGLSFLLMDQLVLRFLFPLEVLDLWSFFSFELRVRIPFFVILVYPL